MSLIVGKDSAEKYPIPTEGAHPATLKAVRDLGTVQTAYGPKHRVRFDWLLDETSPEGAALMCFQTLNVSFADTSALRKAVRQILGRDPGNRFDLETLLGRRVTLVVGHDEANGRTYANVRAILAVREVRDEQAA